MFYSLLSSSFSTFYIVLCMMLLVSSFSKFLSLGLRTTAFLSRTLSSDRSPLVTPSSSVTLSATYIHSSFTCSIIVFSRANYRTVWASCADPSRMATCRARLISFLILISVRREAFLYSPRVFFGSILELHML